MLEYEQNVEDLWYILLKIDSGWQLSYCWHDATILIHSNGQEIHANTLYSALMAALAISDPQGG